MARPQRPRITPIAGPILGEFLIGISVAMLTLWMASRISDATAGAFGMSQQVLESLFVLYRVLALGVGVTITQSLGGRRADAARRTALVGFGACAWVVQQRSQVHKGRRIVRRITQFSLCKQQPRFGGHQSAWKFAEHLAQRGARARLARARALQIDKRREITLGVAA